MEISQLEHVTNNNIEVSTADSSHFSGFEIEDEVIEEFQD